MSSPEQPAESRLVTALGWATVVVSGVGFLTSLLQVGLLLVALGPAVLVSPAASLAIFLPAVGIAIGCGVLQRNDWARVGLICMLVLLAGLSIAQHLLFDRDSEATVRFGAGETGAVSVDPPSLLATALILLIACAAVYVLSLAKTKKEFGR